MNGSNPASKGSNRGNIVLKTYYNRPWHLKTVIKTGGYDGSFGLMAANSGCAGFYLLPYCPDPSDLKNPEVKQKFDDGPLAYITMMPNGVPAMGPKLIGMFVYFFVVAVICAYVVTRTLAPDGH
jgi:hypothetical protein